MSTDNKILYKGIEKGEHIVLALIGMPEYLKFHSPQWYARYSESHNFANPDQEWQREIEVFKANAPKIVNSVEELALIGIEVKGLLAVQPGDIFDLPSGYEFKEDWIPEEDTETANLQRYDKKVIRIVKTEVKEQDKVRDELHKHQEKYKSEPEESQTEILKSLLSTYDYNGSLEAVLREFTISRKSPK